MREANGKRTNGANGMRRAERLVAALRSPDRYPNPADSVELIETHISWVLLAGAFAYKIKKPVKLPFLDFSTLEQRRRFCEEELRLNRRIAPELYLGVVPIGGTPDEPSIGATPAIEYAIELRRFDPDATADRMLAQNAIRPEAILRLAEDLARFHEAAERAEGRPPGGLALENLDQLTEALARAGVAEPIADFRRWTEAQARRLAPVFAERRASAVRDGHGDLHLENVAVIDGRLRPFDMLEFDASLRAVDVLDEAAFLAMDLIVHSRPDFALLFLNRYLEITGDYSGTRTATFYLVYRALVRAKVRAIKAAQSARSGPAEDRVRPYLDAARRLIEPRAPLLVLTHGLSGSGKTTVTNELVPRLPALRIRSDLERKRLHGVAPDVHEELGVGEGRYGRAATDRTYAALAAFAEDALLGGLDVIVDATFLTRARRAPFVALAARCGARAAILECVASEKTLRERIATRAAARADASEATGAVLDAQLREVERPAAAEGVAVIRVDTSAGVRYDELGAAIRAQAAVPRIPAKRR
ncbi:MAG TPA: AAA family ATPase [Gammaproteobacteria bacterium]